MKCRTLANSAPLSAPALAEGRSGSDAYHEEMLEPVLQHV
jgi:hypothetical protein